MTRQTVLLETDNLDELHVTFPQQAYELVFAERTADLQKDRG
jgi:hypothetical protein